MDEEANMKAGFKNVHAKETEVHRFFKKVCIQTQATPLRILSLPAIPQQL
jgi:hypothetical protein